GRIIHRVVKTLFCFFANWARLVANNFPGVAGSVANSTAGILRPPPGFVGSTAHLWIISDPFGFGAQLPGAFGNRFGAAPGGIAGDAGSVLELVGYAEPLIQFARLSFGSTLQVVQLFLVI